MVRFLQCHKIHAIFLPAAYISQMMRERILLEIISHITDKGDLLTEWQKID